MTDDQNQALLHAEESNDAVNDGNSGDDGSNGSSAAKKTDPRDNLTPDHPRFKEVYDELKATKEKAAKVDSLETQVRELQATMSSINKKSDGEAFTDEEKAALARIKKGLQDEGAFVSKQDLEEADRIRNRAETIRTLEGEFNGKNGYPKFDTVEVTEFAQKNGFGGNLRAAYREMHFNAIVKVEAKRGSGEEVADVSSERPSGGGQPVAGEFTRDQIKNMSPEEWKKNEDTIMSKFRKAVTGR
jgi:hypothetical protein